MRRPLRFGVVAVAMATAAGYSIPTVAAAGSAMTVPGLVSAAYPFASDPTDCGAAPVDSTLRPRNEPLEPVIAVNPVKPSNIVVAYIVDGFVLNLVRTSKDGGKTWTTTNKDMCGATNSGTADPYLAFNADGSTLYLAGLAVNGAQNSDQVVINESRDGGLTWSPPTVLTSDSTWKTDMPSVTVDPIDPETAYVTYERHDRETPATSVGAHSTLYVTKTTDGGAHWSSPAVVFTAPTLTNLATPLLSVEPDGVLVDVFEQQIAYTDPGQEDNIDYASMSTDGGLSWSKDPVRIARRTAGPGTDGGPDCGVQTTHRIAVDRNGVLYMAVTQDIRPPFDAGPLGQNSDPRLDTALTVYASHDDGATWTKASEIDAPTLIGMSTIAAAPDGTLAMTYYQMEDTTCGATASDPNFTDPMDLWFARSSDHGRTWSVSKIAGPFDGQASCFLVGTPAQSCGFSDYDGLTSLGGGGFAATFALTTPYAKNGADDIFWSRTR